MTQSARLYRHARFFIVLMSHYELFTDLLETLSASRWPRVQKWVRFFNQKCMHALRVRFFQYHGSDFAEGYEDTPDGMKPQREIVPPYDPMAELERDDDIDPNSPEGIARLLNETQRIQDATDERLELLELSETLLKILNPKPKTPKSEMPPVLTPEEQLDLRNTLGYGKTPGYGQAPRTMNPDAGSGLWKRLPMPGWRTPVLPKDAIIRYLLEKRRQWQAMSVLEWNPFLPPEEPISPEKYADLMRGIEGPSVDRMAAYGEVWQPPDGPDAPGPGGPSAGGALKEQPPAGFPGFIEGAETLPPRRDFDAPTGDHERGPPAG